jgi:hypothetical protein
MTILVGVRCSDGVVIGADSANTFAAGNMRTIEQPSQKISIIANRVIVAGTGEIGMGQRFCSVVESAWIKKEFANRNAVDLCRHLCAQGINDFASTKATAGSYGAMVAFPAGNTAELCEFAVNNFQPELKRSIWYVSMGSGQPIADPCLGFIRQVFWGDSIPSCEDGVFAVVWTLAQAIALNPGGINAPMHVAVLAPDSGKLVASMLTSDEIAEHEDNVRGAIDHLRTYKKMVRGAEASEIPKPPG